MNRHLLAALLVPALLAGAEPKPPAPPPVPAAQPGPLPQYARLTSGADLLRMRKGGLKEETILDFLRTYKATVVLSGQELAEMAAAGFSDGFTRQLLEYVRTQPPVPLDTRPLPPVDPREAGARTDVPAPTVPVPYPDPVPVFQVDYAYDSWALPVWFYAGFGYPWRGYWYGRHGHVGGPFGGHFGGHGPRPGSWGHGGGRPGGRLHGGGGGRHR
jgi:hypothetical protein